MVPTRRLGRSGLVVSTIGLGCNNLGRPGTASESQEGSDAVVHAALVCESGHRVDDPREVAPRPGPGARLRDYYRIEDRQGRRYWIYRQGIIGDGRGGAPDWYLQGLCA